MKKTLSKIAAVYFILSLFTINSQITSIISASAAEYIDIPKVQCVSLSNDLIYGSKDQDTGNQVTLLQVFLVQKGYEIGYDSFGTFGYGTKDSVAAFQLNNNLIPTGFVGANTRQKINDISCGVNYSNLPSTRQISNIPAQTCGVNNGWTWNGTQCVNICDQYHPWNPNTQKCSTENDYYYNYNAPINNPNIQTSCNSGYYWTGSSCSQNALNVTVSSNLMPATMNICATYGVQYVWNGSVCISNTNQNNYTYSYPAANVNYVNSNPVIYNQSNIGVLNSNYTGNCSAYAPNYVWNGSYCVQPQNYSYCGTDTNIYWNGSACVQKYVTQYLCTTNGQYYTNQNYCPSSNGTNNNGYINIYDNYANTYNYLGGINENYIWLGDSCDSCLNSYTNQNQTNLNYNVNNTGYYDVYGDFHQI